MRRLVRRFSFQEDILHEELRSTRPYHHADRPGCRHVWQWPSCWSHFRHRCHDAASGESVETLTVGVIDLNKVGSQAWAVGDKVYWDNTNKRATKTATDNTLIGVALGAVGGGADETTGRVRLNGSF